jgi:hypothetical protein
MRRGSALLFTVGALAACHHKPAPAPEQVATTDMASYQAEIRRVVKDSARADSIVVLTNEYLASLKGFVAEASAYHVRMDSLTRSYSTTRAEIDAELNHQYAARTTRLAALVGFRQRLAALTTDEEWKELGKARVHELQADLTALED